ncbi:glutaredoxin family protein [Kitasatospora sp. NBC_00085]|uniref:glutaredoxin family protein n=1 Tax=unclassified Kitasatospora TaxID=2633591 RepID=UPI003252EC53
MSPLLRRDKNPSPNPAERTVTLVGKPGCHLCDDAREVIVRVAGELGASFEERDITQDEELYRKYWEQIPVTLIDGRQHDFWRVDERRLRAALGA